MRWLLLLVVGCTRPNLQATSPEDMAQAIWGDLATRSNGIDDLAQAPAPDLITSDLLPPDDQSCPQPGQCNCTQGHCVLNCNDPFGCNQTCQGNSSCELDCPQGGCNQSCDSTSECKMTCTGGHCNQTCAGGKCQAT